MQERVSVEKIDETKYKISINVPSDEVDKKFDEFFESVKKQAQVPGFRKGKAPVSRLKTVFGDKARSPVSQMIIGQYYAEAIQKEEISPIGEPEIQGRDPSCDYLGKFGFDNSYSLEMIVEVLPKLDPVGYKNMKLDFPKIETETMFDSKLLGYREQFAERNQVNDRGAKPGDSLVIDFAGFIDGIQFEGGSAKGFSIDKLGRGDFIPGFEDQMVGIKTGETRDIKVTFPAEYHAKHLAGKEAVFNIAVHNIVETKPADVNDDLAMMIGYKSVDELSAKINQEVEEESHARTSQILDGQITSKLLEVNNFDVPKKLVEQENRRLRSRIKTEKLPEELLQQLEFNAERSVKRAIIMDAIYEKEAELEVTPDELNNLLDNHAKQNNKTKDELVSALYNSGQMDNFVGVLRVSKVVDFIISNANKESEKENDRDNEQASG